ALKLLEKNEELKAVYFDENIWAEATKEFLGGVQNYYYLQGQRNNLYKCILNNSLHIINENGFLGLVHPEGIYDDPSGQEFRKFIYPRLKYHFQFKNELMLFSEIDHHNFYGIHIYSGKAGEINFININNLFHPSTIDGSLIHSGNGSIGGLKIKNEQTGKMEWNTTAHKNRVVRITKDELNIIAKTFENNTNGLGTKLVGIHSIEVIGVLRKLSEFSGKLSNIKYYSTDALNETNAPKDGIVIRNTKWADYNLYELIYSGPHFFVSTPLYKTPRSVCKLNSDYDCIDLNKINQDFVPRTNYVPNINILDFKKLFGSNDVWIDSYRVWFSKMISITGERSIQPAILSPKISHVNGVISVYTDSLKNIVELNSITSSLVLDFYIKILAKSNLYDDTLSRLPLGIDNKCKNSI